jgi:hypothetical protein
LVAKAFAPAPGNDGRASTVYDGRTGGPVNRGLTEFVRNTSRHQPLPSDTTWYLSDDLSTTGPLSIPSDPFVTTVTDPLPSMEKVKPVPAGVDDAVGSVTEYDVVPTRKTIFPAR